MISIHTPFCLGYENSQIQNRLDKGYKYDRLFSKKYECLALNVVVHCIS